MWTIRTQLNVKTLKPVRVTFVCPCRGCRRAHSVMLMRFTDRRTDSRWPATPSFWDGAGNRVEFDRIAPTCPEHQRPLRGREVEGVHRESVKCDARCTPARAGTPASARAAAATTVRATRSSRHSATARGVTL